MDCSSDMVTPITLFPSIQTRGRPAGLALYQDLSSWASIDNIRIPQCCSSGNLRNAALFLAPVEEHGLQTLPVYSNQERGLAGLFGLPPALPCRLSPWPVPVIISARSHAGGPSQHTSPTGIRHLGLKVSGCHVVGSPVRAVWCGGPTDIQIAR